MNDHTSMNGNAHQLKVLVVGGGITGLSAAVCCKMKGFDVTVLEASPVFTDIGAGLGMAANSTKVLLDMGTGPGLENCATHQKKTIFVTADGAKVLDVKDFSELEKALGYPMYALHRGDLHSCILEQAHKLGIEIQMGALVKKYDRDLPAAILPDGSLRKADMILVADGYRSHARADMLGYNMEPRASGTSAYRALIPCSLLQDKPELAELLDPRDQATFVWVGEGRHVVAYPVRNGTYYNIILTQPAVRAVGDKYVVQVDPSEVIELYKHWDPRLVTILQHLPKDGTLEWRLCDFDPLESWIFAGGRIALLGDAAHAMLPTSAQGAGMGVEDGAAVAELLARAPTPDDVPRVLKTWEKLRKPRCSTIMLGARGDAGRWHEKDAKAGVTTMVHWDYDIREVARNVDLLS